MAATEDEALQERLKAALWYSIGKIVDEETLKLGVNATPQFIGALTEMVWAQIGMLSSREKGRVRPLRLPILPLPESVSQDVESFAKHASRGMVVVDDVMLLSRRNEGLEAVLKTFLNDYLIVGKKEK
ncbi:hypothetical protein MMC34_001759 [Xylographa carneopallida]|nr:hypothetical protein [Xylographa carneopallida]